MKFLIVVAAILGASMAGEPENRGKRGLISSLGYGHDASLGLSSLHLPLASSVIAAPSISAISSPTIIKTVQTAPIVSSHLLSAPAISLQSAPIVKTVISQPQILNLGSTHSLGLAPSLGLGSSLNLHSLSLGSSIPSIHSSGLINSYSLGGLPLSSHVSGLNAW